MTNRRLFIKSGIIVLLFVVTLLFCMLYGPLNRNYALPPAMRNVENNVDIFKAWEKEEVKGRILFLFDRHNHISPEVAAVSNDNYVSIALRKGIIREVHHIIPVSAWQEVRNKLLNTREFTYKDGVFIMPMAGGRLYVTTIDNIRSNKEKALLVVYYAWSEVGEDYGFLWG